MKTVHIGPSCGKALLKGPESSFDYTLIVSDGLHQVKVLTHRCILSAYSERLRRMIQDDAYFTGVLQVPRVYISAMIQLLQYMYLTNPALITDKDRVLRLCSMLDMPLDHVTIRTGTVRGVNDVNTLNVSFNEGESNFVACDEFLNKLAVKGHVDILTGQDDYPEEDHVDDDEKKDSQDGDPEEETPPAKKNYKRKSNDEEPPSWRRRSRRRTARINYCELSDEE